MSNLDPQLRGSVYGTVYYGGGYYGHPIDAGNATLPTFSALPIITDPLGYTSMSISWQIPTSGKILRLVRSSFGIPVDQNDGLVLFEQSAQQPPLFIDATLTLEFAGKLLYYTLFNQDAAGFWWRAGDNEAILPKNWAYSQRLWQGIPSYYKQYDAAQLQGALNPS